MKVYAVFSDNGCNGWNLEAVFSTKSDADGLAAEFGEADSKVEELELDARVGVRRRRRWGANIDQGGVVRGQYACTDMSDDPPPSEVVEANGGRMIYINSTVSQEHANAKARAEHARRIADGTWPMGPEPEPPRPAPSQPVSRPTIAEQAFKAASELIDERG